MNLEVGSNGPYIDQWYRSRAGSNQVNYGQAVAHELARSTVLDGFEGAQGGKFVQRIRHAHRP
jgi:N-acyl-D-glutamate deacylase